MFELKQFNCRGRFIFRVTKKLLVLVIFIMIWLIIGNINKDISKNKENHVCFSYSMANVSNIVKEINMNGHARIPPINDFLSEYEVLLDPSSTFCNFRKCPVIDMIFVVKSYALHFKQREAIRRTWGGVRSIHLKTVFVLGLPEHDEDEIQKEFENHKDILLFNIRDKYENLVYKTMFSSIWLSNLNSKIKYVHFLDDDRIVNTQNVYLTAKYSILQTDEKMMGYVLENSVPRRSPMSKHYVSKIDYPSTYFPPYLIGGTILTNMRVVRLIAKAVPYVKILKIEDVYVGIVAKLMQIELQNHAGFLPFYEPPSNLVTKLSSPGYESYDDVISAWHVMTKI